MAETRLVTLVRRSRGAAGNAELVAVTCRSVEALQPSAPRVASWPQWELEEVPIEALAAPLAKEAASVMTAWGAIARVRMVGAETMANFLTILLETVPDLRSRAGRAVLAKVDEAKPVRATAAHPRAFRGTKDRPPKRAKPSPLDLRSELVDRGTVGRRLAESRAFIAPAIDRLAVRGYSRERLASIAGGAEPYLAYHHRAKTGASFADFPSDFVRVLLPALRRGAVTMAEVAAWRAHWSAASRDEPLRAALVRLALLAPREALRVGPLWTGAADEQRALVVRVVTAFDVGTIAKALTGAQWLAHAETFHGLLAGTSDDLCGDRLAYLLRTASAGASVDYALDWIGVAGHVLNRTAPREVGLDSDARWKDVEDLAGRVDDKAWFPSWLLGMCGRLPGLARWIRETDWNRFAPATAIKMVERVANLAWDDLPAENLQAKWAFIRSELPRLLDWLHAEVPEAHKESTFVLLCEVFSDWGRNVADLAARLPTAYAIVRRIGLPPFRRDACNDWLVTPLVRGLHDHPQALQRFLHAPERCFRAMVRAVRRENDALLAGRGFGILLRYLPDFAIEVFVAYPTRVMAVSRTLGALDYDEGCQRVREFAWHRLLQLRARSGTFGVDSTPLDEQARLVVEEVSAFVGPRAPNPVPRRLREFVRGRTTLRDSQVVRHLRRVRVRLDPLILAALEELVLGHARASIHLDPSADAAHHALLVERNSDENRRPLRRLLKAVASGDHDYLERHPATLAYRRAHPALGDRTWARWLEGLTLEGRYRGNPVRLGVERDTLEVLRMGTYAGTCLGLGGGHVYSAAAVALDLNKRVVYARNQAGAVVARQLLALSEDDRLVCFHVYPLDADSELQEVFARYDRDLANALALPLYAVADGSERDAEIACILSRGFWNDGAWDLRPRIG